MPAVEWVSKWPDTRVTVARALVEAYATADIDQQDAIQNRQARSTQQKTDVTALRKEYSRASRLAKIAIRDLDPADAQQLRELLGLN